jgi:uncharacterized protein YlxP (DUF503 family)
MRVGILELELRIPDSGSLKEKRVAVRGLKDRIRSRFNISIAEVDHGDKWQRATIAIAAVGADSKYINGMLCKIVDLVRSIHSVELMDYRLEML